MRPTESVEKREAARRLRQDAEAMASQITRLQHRRNALLTEADALIGEVEEHERSNDRPGGDR